MDFDHNRRPALINLMIWVMAAVWLLVLLSFLPKERSLFVLSIGGVLAVTLLVIGVSPLLTPHKIADGKIIIRQGWHSWMVVPVGQVGRIQRMEKIDVKEGILLDAFNKTLVLTGSKTNGIRLELKEEVRVPSAFWKRVKVVIFDVDDPDRFIAEVGNAL
ncbi:MAG: hypothetical protein E4H30_05555 [Methanomassiliicoccus sp.]|nr:MAG: hypothetical protein E4H30_05555 [Methanomassiliicoccus sp.]